MACRLFGTKPLSDLTLVSCLLTPWKHFLWNFDWNKTVLLQENEVWNTVCEWRPFCLGLSVIESVLCVFSGNRRKIKVQCFPLYSILLAVGITKIDFFSLDVEGAEQIVLDSIPFDKVDIGLFVIEYLDIKEKKLKRLEGFRKFFERHPEYKYVGEHHGVDALFQKW